MATIIFWGGWGWLVYSFPPSSPFLILAFGTLLWLAVFLTSGLIFGNSKIGALVACWLLLFLIFRYFKIGNILNLSLLTIIFFLLAFSFYKRVT